MSNRIMYSYLLILADQNLNRKKFLIKIKHLLNQLSDLEKKIIKRRNKNYFNNQILLSSNKSELKNSSKIVRKNKTKQKTLGSNKK